MSPFGVTLQGGPLNRILNSKKEETTCCRDVRPGASRVQDKK